MEVELADMISLFFISVGVLVLFSLLLPTESFYSINNLPNIVEVSDQIYEPGVYAYYDVNSKNLTLLSKSTFLFIIDKIVLKSSDSDEIVIKEMPTGGDCAPPSKYLPPGSSMSIECAEYTPVSIIGERGEMIPVNKIWALEPVVVNLNETNLLENRLSYFEGEQGIYISPSLISPTKEILQTMKNSLNRFGLKYEGVNASVEANVLGSNIIITKNVGEESYNILIAGGDSSTTNRYVKIGSQRFNIKDNDFYKRYRLVITGFRGQIINATDINDQNALTKPGIYRNLTLVLSGTASRVSFYTILPYQTYLGYEPYFVYGDLFGRGYPSFVFTTIDYYTYGNENAFNDIHPLYSGIDALDYSKYPLRIILNAFPINSSVAKYVRVSVKLWFFDNSLTNTGETPDNYPILIIGLYDPASGSYVASYPVTYYELQRFEGYGYTKEYLIPILTENRNYYVGLDVIDPYEQGFGNTVNDLDFTLIIEYVGVVLGTS